MDDDLRSPASLTGRALEWGQPPAARLAMLLRRPAALFAGLTDCYAWLWPALVMFVVMLLYCIPVSIMIGATSAASLRGSLEGELNDMPEAIRVALVEIMPAIQRAGPILAVPMALMMSWFLRTGMFYLLGSLFTPARPPIRQVASMVAWAWLPLALQDLALALAMIASPELVPLIEPGASGQLATDGFLGFAGWGMVLTQFASPLVWWNLALCFIGVRTLFGLGRGAALAVVAVPTALDLALKVLTMMAGSFLHARLP